MHDSPLFVGKRHFRNKEDFQSYLDDEVIEDLEEISTQAAVYIIGFFRSINLQPNEDASEQTYQQMPELS